MKIKVIFYSKLLDKEIVKEFSSLETAVEFAKGVNGIVVA